VSIMPRRPRLDISGALHQIMVRGVDRVDIFLDDEDRHGFLKKLGELIVNSKSQVYAWTLMTNHVHILYKSGEKGISYVMRRLLTWFAIYFNRRYKRSGHLFENRYKSILCEEEQYLLELVRYIHLNPVRAGLVSTLRELDRYPWCGHAVLVGSMSMGWMARSVSIKELQTGSRRRGVSEARAVISFRSIEELGLATAEIARSLGVATSGYLVQPKLSKWLIEFLKGG